MTRDSATPTIASGDEGSVKPATAHAALLTLRPALQSDLVPLSFFFDTALRKDYFLRRGQLAEILSDARHDVYIAELDCVLVGAAIVTRGQRLVNVLVHPAYRGLGIGRALIQRSEAREVRAKCDMSAGDPRPFYRSLGFEPTGERNAKGNIEIMRRDRQGRGVPRERKHGREQRGGRHRSGRWRARNDGGDGNAHPDRTGARADSGLAE